MLPFPSVQHSTCAHCENLSHTLQYAHARRTGDHDLTVGLMSQSARMIATIGPTAITILSV